MRFTIKYKLLLPILATVIVGMAAIQTLTSMKASSVLEQQIFEGIETDATESAIQMNMWLEDRLTDFTDWSKNHLYGDALEGDAFALSEVNTLLKHKVEDYPYYDSVNLLSTDGLVIASCKTEQIGLDLKSREYFQQAMAGNASISDPLISKATGLPIFTVTQPIRDASGTVIGALSGVVKLDMATDKFIGRIKIGETGYAFISDSKGMVIAHPDKDFVFKLDVSSKDFGKEMLARRDGTYKYYFAEQDSWKGMGFHEIKSTGWIVAVTAPLDELMAELDTLVQYAIIGTVTTVVLAALVILFFVSQIVRSIVAASAQMELLAKGDVSKDVNDKLLKMNDELGDLSKSCQTLILEERQRAEAARSIADGDLRVEVNVASEADLLGNALKDMTDSLNSVMRGVNDAAVQVAAGSGEVSDSSQALSQGATEQAASIEEITSSMTELGTQTRNNAETATQANDLAEAARNAAAEGNEKMAHMNQAMGDISESSQAIAKIIKVIDEIAFQTNLLALNAAVEAARAGRHGKGFAVVAEEVRNLAGRSAKAAEETTQLIESSIEKVNLGSSAAGETAEVLTRIADEAGKVADMLQVISQASSEQAEGISQIGEGLNQIDQVTQQNTASAEETASAAEELSAQSSTLRQLLARFKLKGGSDSSVVVQQSRPQALPQAQSKTRSAAPKAAPRNSGWGGAPEQSAQPEEIIALDDDEFGKY